MFYYHEDYIPLSEIQIHLFLAIAETVELKAVKNVFLYKEIVLSFLEMIKNGSTRMMLKLYNFTDVKIKGKI